MLPVPNSDLTFSPTGTPAASAETAGSSADVLTGDTTGPAATAAESVTSPSLTPWLASTDGDYVLPETSPAVTDPPEDRQVEVGDGLIIVTDDALLTGVTDTARAELTTVFPSRDADVVEVPDTVPDAHGVTETEAVPAEAVPAEAVPAEAVAAEAVAAEAVPVEASPVEPVPVESVPDSGERGASLAPVPAPRRSSRATNPID